jgi:hypothetical protein
MEISTLILPEKFPPSCPRRLPVFFLRIARVRCGDEVATPQLTPDQIGPRYGARGPIYLHSAGEVRAPSDPVVPTAEGYYEGILFGATSGECPPARAARGAGCQPRLLPDAEKLGLQQFARPVHHGCDYVLRCCSLARAILERIVVSRTRPCGAVSATWHPTLFCLHYKPALAVMYGVSEKPHWEAIIEARLAAESSRVRRDGPP